MSVTIDDTVVSDRERVEAWRLEELLRADYPVELAERLAASECDLHLAIDMIRQGCDFETAAEILL